jgi:hypothetical protein
MSNRFASKDLCYEVEIDGVKFTLKRPTYEDYSKLRFYNRNAIKLDMQSLKVSRKYLALSPEEQEKTSEDFSNSLTDIVLNSDLPSEEDQQKLVELIKKYIVKIEGVEIPIADVNFNPKDITSLFHKLFSLSVEEDVIKNSVDSPNVQ